jgi:hypothetical protein
LGRLNHETGSTSGFPSEITKFKFHFWPVKAGNRIHRGQFNQTSLYKFARVYIWQHAFEHWCKPHAIQHPISDVFAIKANWRQTYFRIILSVVSSIAAAGVDNAYNSRVPSDCSNLTAARWKAVDLMANTVNCVSEEAAYSGVVSAL